MPFPLPRHETVYLATAPCPELGLESADRLYLELHPERLAAVVRFVEVSAGAVSRAIAAGRLTPIDPSPSAAASAHRPPSRAARSPRSSRRREREPA